MAAKKKSKPAKKNAPKKKSATKKVTPKKPAKKKLAPKKAAAKKPAKTIAKKPAAKKPAAKKVAPKKAAAKIVRRDATGHLNPKYARKLLEESGKGDDEDTHAFRVKSDSFAEELGEEVVGKANSGEDEGEDDANREEIEEVGGPFVITTGNQEFADGTDESNPEGADREPFPKT